MGSACALEGLMRAKILLIAICLTGCATARQAETPPPAPIVCKTGADCDAKWSRALAWVTQNSQWRIQVQTDLLIQTFNGVDDAETSPGFTINKVAKGAGTYEISFSAGCHNLFGCVPSAAEERQKFAAFING